MRIADNITELIGHTPLVRISKLNDGKAEIVAKVESFNPGSSVKDRIAQAMIEDAERRGLLKSGGLIIDRLPATPALDWHWLPQSKDTG